MSIYQTAVRKPITTILVFVAIAVLGLFSLSKLPIDLYPKFETNNIMVITSYPGAGPTDVETNVTTLIENSLNGIANVKHITSQNREGTSVVSLQFNEGINLDEVTNDIRDKLGILTDALPDGARQPILFKFGVEDIPVIILGVTAKESTPALQKILEDQVTNQLARIDGVGAVFVAGADQREIQVYCDPAKLEAYSLTIPQIAAVIRAENADFPVGQVDIGSQTHSIRVQGEFKDPQELLQLVVANRMGRNIYLSDVARLKDARAERQQENFLNGERSAMIVINKQSDANSVAVTNKILKELPNIQRSLPADIQLEEIMNTSRFIENAIGNLTGTIFVTFLVVMLVVLFFLGRWRATFIIILTIPISLVVSFIYLMLTGNTLNIISMSSLSIAIGMVVDDAIVVLENITTHIERGSYPRQAAVHATNEVAISVVASTLTLLAVFLPLTMLGGMAGIMFRQLGWIVSIIMIISTVCALTLTPTLSAYMLRRRLVSISEGNRFARTVNRWLSAVDRLYVRMLHWALGHRTAVILSSIGLFILTIFLAQFIKTEFMPQTDNSHTTVSIELPVSSSLEETRRVALEMDKRWRKKFPEIEIMTFSAGQADAGNLFAAMNNNGSNIASFNIRLCDPADRDLSIYELADEMRLDLAQIPAIERYVVTPGGLGGGGGQTTVNIEIYGYDFDETGRIVRQVQEVLIASGTVAEATINRRDNMPEYKMQFDRQKLGEHGLTMAQASAMMNAAISGQVASFFREDGKEYEIRVRMEPDARKSLSSISNLLLYTPQGKAIRLTDLGTIEEIFTPPTIFRKNQQRVVTLSCVAKAGVPLSDLVKKANKVMKETQLPAGVTYKLAGSYEQQQEAFGDMGILLMLIILLVFIVMAAEFESLRDPFVIMFSVPFAFTGVILGLLLTRVPLSIVALIGAIMLVGIVVKNGIVLIDYTRLCKERGLTTRQALLSAGQSRLRPVLMTTLTTILGMIPMAIGLGEGSETWRPMGVTVAFGLAISTLVTLILIPTIYASFCGVSAKHQRWVWRRKLWKRKF